MVIRLQIGNRAALDDIIDDNTGSDLIFRYLLITQYGYKDIWHKYTDKDVYMLDGVSCCAECEIDVQTFFRQA